MEETLAELFELRGLIETEAAGMAARNASAEDVARIAERFATFVATCDRKEPLLESDVALHRSIIEASGNRFMIALAALSETAIRATSRIWIGHPDADAIRLHGLVVEKIAARDAGSARRAMRQLMRLALANAKSGARRRGRRSA